MSANRFNFSGAVVVGSAIGNAGCVFTAESDSEVLEQALDAWLKGRDVEGFAGNEVAELKRQLDLNGFDAAKAFALRNLESLSISLAGSALWTVIQRSFGI